MRQAVILSALLFVEVLLLVVGRSGLSSATPSFVAVGYIAIAGMIAAPFYAANRMSKNSSI